MRFPWEMKTHVKMISFENLLCNCICILAREITNKKCLIAMIFVDDGTHSASCDCELNFNGRNKKSSQCFF